MANYYVGQMFGTLKVLRCATTKDLQIQLRRPNPKSTHRYWYCVCQGCGLVFVVRGDNLPKKKHKCFVEKVKKGVTV